jgi:hypothetical protein
MIFLYIIERSDFRPFWVEIPVPRPLGWGEGLIF